MVYQTKSRLSPYLFTGIFLWAQAACVVLAQELSVQACLATPVKTIVRQQNFSCWDSLLQSSNINHRRQAADSIQKAIVLLFSQRDTLRAYNVSLALLHSAGGAGAVGHACDELFAHTSPDEVLPGAALTCWNEKKTAFQSQSLSLVALDSAYRAYRLVLVKKKSPAIVQMDEEAKNLLKFDCEYIQKVLLPGFAPDSGPLAQAKVINAYARKAGCMHLPEILEAAAYIQQKEPNFAGQYRLAEEMQLAGLITRSLAEWRKALRMAPDGAALMRCHVGYSSALLATDSLYAALLHADSAMAYALNPADAAPCMIAVLNKVQALSAHSVCEQAALKQAIARLRDVESATDTSSTDCPAEVSIVLLNNRRFPLNTTGKKR